jgi:hypothetical protein
MDPMVGPGVSVGVGCSVGSGRGVMEGRISVGGTTVTVAVGMELEVEVAGCSAVAGEEQAASNRAINRKEPDLEIPRQYSSGIFICIFLLKGLSRESCNGRSSLDLIPACSIEDDILFFIEEVNLP